jgi:DoxX-like family
MLGHLFDIALCRPLMGWATAWSFDRLRLWIEAEIVPEAVLRSSVIYAICRGLVSFIWIWHGLVPKLLFHDPAELAMLSDAGIAARWLPLIGAAEVIFGLLGLFAWRWRGFLILTSAAMLGALIAVALRTPAQLTAAFNPITLNLSVVGLCAGAWLAYSSSAFASRCRRKPQTTKQKRANDAIYL